jgi:hypothetical protein
MEFWRLNDCVIESCRFMLGRVRSTVVEDTVPPVVQPVGMLRLLVLDEDRCRRRWDGVGPLGPESIWFVLWSPASSKPVEVEDELDTTDAFWAARSMDNSRVRRLT